MFKLSSLVPSCLKKTTPAQYEADLADVAARELVQHRAFAEYHNAMADFYQARINRLAPVTSA